MDMFGGAVSYVELTLSIICVLFLYYFTKVVHKPRLHCQKHSPWSEKLKSSITELQKDQWPLLWCIWPLWQAIFHTICMKPIHFDFERKEIFLDDGGSFNLDFFGFVEMKDENDDKNKPIILILPGATGDSSKVYVREFVAVTLKQKYRAVCMNFRGWGKDTKLRTERMSCVTNSTEIEAALHHLNTNYAGSPVMVVAASIGACTFMNYLVRKRSSLCPNLVSAMLIGVPWDPMESKYLLSTFWNRLIINTHMTNNLIEKVKSNLDVVSKNVDKYSIDLENVFKSKTVWDFDDRYICPMFGYRDHVEFYSDAGLNTLPLEKITIPVLALCTEDDPLCRGHAIPFDNILRNPLLSVITTKYGGHLTWLEGILPTRKRFPHRVFEQYSQIFFEEKKIDNFDTLNTTTKM